MEAVTEGRHGSAYSKRLHDNVSSPRTRPGHIRRASDHEPRLEQVAALLYALPVRHVEQQLHRALGDLARRLVDGRQGRRGERGEPKIVEADDRDLVRNAPTSFTKCADHPDRGEVVSREDRAELPAEQSLDGRVSPLCSERADGDEPGVD